VSPTAPLCPVAPSPKQRASGFLCAILDSSGAAGNRRGGDAAGADRGRSGPGLSGPAIMSTVPGFHRVQSNGPHDVRRGSLVRAQQGPQDLRTVRRDLSAGRRPP